MAASGEKETAEPRVAHPDDDEVVGRPKAKPSGRFFGFGGGSTNSDTPEISIGKSSITKDDQALLQEALFDLLECKRLLDQVR
jgi:hypothetical protein